MLAPLEPLCNEFILGILRNSMPYNHAQCGEK